MMTGGHMSVEMCMHNGIQQCSQRAGHEPVFFVADATFSPACALLEFTKASAQILRGFIALIHV